MEYLGVAFSRNEPGPKLVNEDETTMGKGIALTVVLQTILMSTLSLI